MKFLDDLCVSVMYAVFGSEETCSARSKVIDSQMHMPAMGRLLLSQSGKPPLEAVAISSRQRRS